MQPSNMCVPPHLQQRYRQTLVCTLCYCMHTIPHLDVVLQRLCESPLLQDPHGLAEGTHAWEDQPLGVADVRGLLNLCMCVC